MNRGQFFRALRKHCRDHDLPAPQVNLRRGKGGHAVIMIGERFTVCPAGELKRGTLEGMLKQLGLPKDAV